VGRCNTLAGFGGMDVLPSLAFVLMRLRRDDGYGGLS